MKKLIIIVFAFTVISCGNKKHELVELIKTCKDSIETISREEKRMQLLIENWHSAKGGNLDKELKSLAENAKIKTDLVYRKQFFINRVDSLELELKKY